MWDLYDQGRKTVRSVSSSGFSDFFPRASIYSEDDLYLPRSFLDDDPAITALPDARALQMTTFGPRGPGNRQSLGPVGGKGMNVREPHRGEKRRSKNLYSDFTTTRSSYSKDVSSSSDTDSKEDAGDPLDNLPAHEKEILRRQLETPAISVSYKLLYRYATRNDLLIIAGSTFFSIAGGAVMPLMTIVFGNLSELFKSFFLRQISQDAFESGLGSYTIDFLYLALGEFTAVYLSTVGWAYTGEHITSKIRENYLAAILRQNIGFFDKLGAGEITTRITADTNLIQEGISGKVGLTLTALATFFTSFIVGFTKNWELTLILLSSIVAIALTMSLGSKWIVKWNKASLDAYAAGGTVAEEVLSSIRNATAFSTQEKLARQYDTYLEEAERWGIKNKTLLGFLIGVMMCLVYMTYGLAFWQGSRFLVANNGITLSEILTILLAVMVGAFSLGNVAPNAAAFATAVAAAGKIFSTIDRKSPMDPDRSDGKILENVRGDLELRNISHIYPSRPESRVMDGVDLFIPAGKTTALVGASGSGKSTIVGLVERFYDPVGGQVLLDGVDISTINLRFLRQQISLVSQEPTLFGTTIYGNIAHGLIGTKYEHVSDDVKRKLVYEAAKMANAHDFVTDLPGGYETNVGERGFLLSGGQKQRIAIARSVVSNPRILLLDEATSALDTKSEGVVQKALDNAAKGRTTIMIAHRLSTIRNADSIVVMSEGRIIEQGTHSQLLQKKGAYFSLVEAQQIAATEQHTDPEKVKIAEDVDNNEKANRPFHGRRRQSMFRTITQGSASSNIIISQPEEVKKDYGVWTLIKLVASFNAKEWWIMLIGLGSSIIAGGGNPVQAVFFAKCIVALSKPTAQYDELRSQINFWCLMFLMLGGSQLLAHTGHGTAFAICSERLIRRVRIRAFRTMLRQDIGFFDREENSAGALTSFLSTQTTQVAGLSGSTLGTLLTIMTTLVAGFALSLAENWKLSLVCISTVPIVLACGFLRFYMLARFAQTMKRSYEKSASYACEATSAIRTVASLTREHDVWEHYHNQLVEQNRLSLISISRSATLYAGSQAFMFLCIALGFWYGGRLVGNLEIGLFAFFVCYCAVIFGAQSAGTIFSFAPDMGKAKMSAGQLKELFDRQPEIDAWDDGGKKLDHVNGDIEFEDVHFRYPTRKDQPVLRGLNLRVPRGQYIALVGPSGCGKSTTIGLLERFYNPLVGKITLDGHDISALNLKSYRSHVALVSQEPTLYQGTIRENILLGADHPDNVGDEQIEQACRDANILSFIQSLPDGFATAVGGKGVMLSGGQKQRVAIARALLRNPKVLLLDEATSALDSESEKIVQAALDLAAKGRTTIAVAHRLSTIQKADCIYVFEGGRVYESGTHHELMRKGGRYKELVSLQSLAAS